MPNSIYEPIAYNTTNSYVISVQKVAQSRVVAPKVASKQFILKAMADFVATTANDLKKARQNNRLILHNLD